MALEQVRRDIARHAEEIKKHFVAGAKVTVIVRNPGRGAEAYSADLLVTDDDINEVEQSLRYLKSRDEGTVSL